MKSNILPSLTDKSIVEISDLCTFISEFKPDVIHSHLFYAEIITRWQLIEGIKYTSTVREVHWHVVCDQAEAGPAELRWALYRTDGPVVRKGSKKITLAPDTSTLAETLDFGKEMLNPGPRHLVLAGEIRRGRTVLARNTALLTAPLFVSLSKRPIKVVAKRLDDETTSVTVSSDVYHHRVELSLPGADAWWSDNFFDLLPGQTRTVELRRASPGALKKLKARSLVHTAGS